jgi:hypothetical protein
LLPAKNNLLFTIKSMLILSMLVLPVLCSAQEGRKKIFGPQGKLVGLYFTICHKDSNRCDRHSALMTADSFATEERMDKRLIASIQGGLNKAYSPYFEKVYNIPESDFELLSKAHKRKKAGIEQIYTIDLRVNGVVKKYELSRPKWNSASRNLLNQFNKIAALAADIRKEQNAYDKKQLILNNH